MLIYIILFIIYYLLFIIYYINYIFFKEKMLTQRNFASLSLALG
ncbi:hypothetical protein RINTU1_22800 [Candidatus Regiella insecticola]|uniref:Uncharacterized protein n=1 Tax=Candidatus Regiella insecticola TaxID=138073 RepID=A0A6L2ZQA4_9ENTR|nr:hypothetical protein RINTU1_22800 [Candidatus Regiella insecticola]